MAAAGRANASDALLSGQAPTLSFSTDALPERDRIGFVREVVGQKMLRLDLEPVAGDHFHTSAVVRSLPGLDVIWSNSSAMRASRTRALLSDGNDNLVVQCADAPGQCAHLRRDLHLGRGDAVVLSSSDLGSVTFPSQVSLISLSVPRNALGPLLHDTDGCLARPVAGSSHALQMLLRYLDILRDESGAPTRELQALAVQHVYDLLAIALGATRDAAERARKGGMRAARLEAIKRDIEANLTHGGLSVTALAARYKMTPRSVQMLFEEAGTTFTEFVRRERLERVHRMLASRRFDHMRIADIAFACGFGDLSYFNRAFRARYRAAPSDIRIRNAGPADG